MAGLAESLSVVIGANSDPLVQELNKAASAVKKWGKDVGGTLDSVKSMTEALAGAIGIGFSAEFAKSLLETAQALEEQASQVGLNVEKYQALTFAAGQAGVGQETFATGLDHLSKTLGHAQAGVQAAEDIFAKWSIAIKDSHGNALDFDTVLSEVADRMASITNPAMQNAFAMDVMQKSGAALVNMLKQGSGGLDEMRQKAIDAGAVLGKDTVEQAAAANRELTLLTTVIKDKLTIGLMDILPSAKQFEGWLNNIAILAHGAAAALATIRGAFSGGGTDLNALYDNFAKSAGPDLSNVIAAAPTLPLGFGGGRKSIAGGFMPSDPAAARAQAKRDLEAAIAQQKLDDDTAQSIQDMIDRIREETKELGLNNTQREISKELYAAELIARKDNRSLTQEETNAITSAATAYAKESEAILAQKTAMEDAKKYADALASSVTNVFSEAIDGAKTFNQLLLDMVTALQKTILQFTILEPLQNSLRSAFGGAPSGIANATSGISGFFGNIFGDLFRAGGGGVQGGDPYIVGERGPELFVPNVSGSIVPNSRMSSLSGASGPVFNMNVSVSGPAAGDPKTAAQAGNAFALAAKSAMLGFLQDQKRSGGVLARA